jgi:hypothetical protein
MRDGRHKLNELSEVLVISFGVYIQVEGAKVLLQEISIPCEMKCNFARRPLQKAYI